MTFRLVRHPASEFSTQGDLALKGDPWTCYTLEPKHPIPASRYEVVLSVSQRSIEGRLWSPREDHVLPLLVGVVGHTGVRIHALNRPEETEGCIGVGCGHGADELLSSRPALIALMAKLEAAEAAAERSFLEIADA